MESPGKRTRIRGPENRAKFRDQILAEAKHIYATDGYEAVSVRAVTKAVGISPMAFYGYFSSKQDLVKYIWSDFFQELHEAMSAAALHKRSPQARLKAHIEAYLEYWETHPERYRMVYLVPTGLEDGERIRFDEEDSITSQLLALSLQRVSECVEGGSCSAEDIKLKADLMFVKALGYLHGVLTVGRYPFDNVERLREWVVDDIIAGIERMNAH